MSDEMNPYKGQLQTQFVTINGSPEGVEYGYAGRMVMNGRTGLVYVKSTPIEVNTGWLVLLTVAPSGNNAFYAVETVADLRAVTAPVFPSVAVTYGQFVAGDNNGAAYSWYSGDTTDDDGMFVIKPSDVGSTDPGRWRLQPL